MYPLKNIPKIALSKWEVPEIASIEELDQHDHLFKICTNGLTYMLKFLGKVPPDTLKLEFDQRVMKHLLANDMNVAIPLRSRIGRICEWVDGRYFILSEYIDSPPQSDEQNSAEKEFRRDGQLLARIHNALALFPEEHLDEYTWRDDYATQLDKWFYILGGALPDQQSVIIEHIEKKFAETLKSNLKVLPEQLIHRDYHADNLLINGEREPVLIDCDHFCIAPPLFDLASYACNSVKWHVQDRPWTDQWLQDFPSFIEGYLEKRSLSEEELQAFPYMMMVYHLLLCDWFVQTDQIQFTQTDIDCLEWIAMNLELLALK